MSLAPGTRLGPYEVTSAIGAGGMGEVFRARDTKLNREVAIKVLPAAFADDPERLARFTREAQTLASLNHPNIATIHGIEELPAANGSGGGSRALVMELVEGEDLSTHMARGPIPVAEALPIARQIAEALEAAHEQGVVHRDLKPANIKVRTDGTVKVLDFGLAKAMDPASASSSNPNVSHSPTLTHQGTSAGMIIGTAAYMSPEQAKGKPVDKRADIWAFGVVLYEMLTGRRAFKGEDVSETLAAVLMTSPSMDALPATVPPRLRRLIERCLDRDLRKRLRDIGEARVQIGEIMSGATEVTGGPTAQPSARMNRRERLAWWIAVGGVLVAMGLGYSRRSTSDTLGSHSVRLNFEPPEGVSFPASRADFLVVSPNGRMIVFTGITAEGKRQLWLRSLDSLEAEALPDTQDALWPFWSPDSRSIAFGAQGRLKRLDLGGGKPRVLCDSPRIGGGTWSREGVILFVPNWGAGVSQVSATGGEPKVLTHLDSARGEGSHRGPSFLPDGRHFLVSANANQGDTTVLVGSLDTGELKPLFKGAKPVYAPPGYVLFVRDNTLYAQPFDARKLESEGEPTPLFSQPDVGGVDNTDDGLRFSVSENGVLSLAPSFNPDYQLIWFDRRGARLAPVGPTSRAAMPMLPRLSPDGTRVVWQIRERLPERNGLWVADLDRNIPTRLTGLSQYPQWSPDGSRVAWVSTKDGVSGIRYKAASGVGDEPILLRSGEAAGGATWPIDWSPDGRVILYLIRVDKTRGDIWGLPLSESGDTLKPGAPHPVLATEFDERGAQFSPDGRFLAYVSDLSGSYEVYVQDLNTDGKAGSQRFRISPNGGSQVRFRRDGKELLYIAGDGQMMATTIRLGAAFSYDAPKPLFPTRTLPRSPETATEFDVTRDGQRFLIGTVLDTPNAAAPRPVIVLNWTAELAAKREGRE